MARYHSWGQRECLAEGEEEPQPPQPFDYADDFDQVYEQTAKDVVSDMLDTIDVVDDLVEGVEQNELMDILEGEDEDDLDAMSEAWLDGNIDRMTRGIAYDTLYPFPPGEESADRMPPDLIELPADEEWPDVSTGQEKEEEFYEVNERRCLSCFGEEEPLEQCCGCEASSSLWHYECVANMIIANEDKACTRCHYRYHHPDMERRSIRNPPETWRFFWRNLLEMPWFYGGLLFGVLIIGINISHAISRKLHPTRNEERYAIWYATGLYFLVALIFLVRVALRSRREETGFHDEIWFRNWPKQVSDEEMAGRRKVSFDDIHAGKCHPIEHIHHMLVYHPNDERECLAEGEEEPQPPQPFDYADDFDQVYDQTAKDVVNDMVDTIEVVDGLVDGVEQDELMDILEGEEEDDLDAMSEAWLDGNIDRMTRGIAYDTLYPFPPGEESADRMLPKVIKLPADEEWPPDPDSTGQEKEEELNERRCLACFGEEEPLEQCCRCEASSNLWHYQCVAEMIIRNEDKVCTRCHRRYHHPNIERGFARYHPRIGEFLLQNVVKNPLVYAVAGVLILFAFVISYYQPEDEHQVAPIKKMVATFFGTFSFVIVAGYSLYLFFRYRYQESGLRHEIRCRDWPERGLYPNDTRVHVWPNRQVGPVGHQNYPV